MQKARMLGNYISKCAKEKDLSISDLSEILNCDKNQVCALYKGRVLLSFDQLSRLAKKLDKSVSALMTGDEAHYNSSVVHCMNPFQDTKNREFILDIIDDYIDIVDAQM